MNLTRRHLSPHWKEIVSPVSDVDCENFHNLSLELNVLFAHCTVRSKWENMKNSLAEYEEKNLNICVLNAGDILCR